MNIENIIAFVCDNFGRIIVALVGGVFGIIAPTIPFALICIFAAILDSISAWRLAKRIKRNHPEIPDSQIHAKFESEKFFNIFPKLLMVYLIIILVHLIDAFCLPFLDMYLPNYVAAAFCFYEAWSVLENESSECNRSWAKFLQRYMIDKSSRHIEGLKEALEDTKESME